MTTLPEAIVLAGGLGTRLRGAIDAGLPKLLAPVHDRPFLDYLLAWAEGQGLRHLCFALGHHAAAVLPRLEAARPRFAGLRWTVEAAPLGTAGAIATAIAGTDATPRLILNGDTLVEVSLDRFRADFRRQAVPLALVAARVPDPGRYGQLDLDENGMVRRFQEKPAQAVNARIDTAWINAGLYLAGEAVLARIAALGRGSFEREVMMALPPGSIRAFCGAGRFIDIGTAASLAEAQAILAPLSAGPGPQILWAGAG